ncbi:MAG: deoxyribonuclease IV [Acholeplasmatales bacterium]|jgi:deoxyribonuclease-4|nr:deoxyribonuclease IV [Acholeplasmataceae bacterium]MCK9289825.1 deoxyribonuclease IV [Acholeplasmataceae bacterium]MDY0115701.1 deoxyribonuclease IV [Acholeplasmatales bacterium]
MILGSHVKMSGKKMMLGSVEEALSYGANTFMIYTGAPQNTRRRKIEELNIPEALELMKAHDIDVKNIVIHAPYIMNLANPSLEKRQFAIDFLTSEIERSAAMEATQIVLHPGSAVGLDREEAIRWIGEGLNKVIANTKDLKVKIALETMAGKGNEVGRTFEELKAIIDLVADKTRVSVCFDTCHTHDSGYDIKENFKGVLEEFDKVVGKKYLSVFHINDSKNIKGARKDRHENLGFGEIGFKALVDIIYDEEFKAIPKILETPYIGDNPPYKEEIEMIKNRRFESDLKTKLLKQEGE